MSDHPVPQRRPDRPTPVAADRAPRVAGDAVPVRDAAAMGVRQIPSDLRRAARVSGACEPGVQVPQGFAFVVPWRATPELCDWLAEEALRDPSQVWYVASPSAAADEAADQHYVFPEAWIGPDAP